ncbi:uncharacterized protein LOC124147621 [Haliotis rufescens]|uniref:uncharacterized protein LOC124147621 n=1 Tax=Haliotis rufescens TaxID=6454 RepID=UPI00201EF5FB|nr:uncharacterized protein LOC124147621 [Haliotis rufescens]
MSRRVDVERKAMLDRLTRLRIDQHKPRSDDSDGEVDLVTLMKNKCGSDVFDPSSRFSTEGFAYTRSRGRRKSKEFEDLLMHTATGSLHLFALTHKSGFLRPKTSSPRRQATGHDTLPKSTDENKSSQLHKTHRPLQRSVSDLHSRVSSLGTPPQPREHTGSPPTPGSPASKRVQKQTMSPLASPKRQGKK